MTQHRAATIELILASGSPRRQQLLRECGYTFRVVLPPHDEPANLAVGLTPAQLAEALSYYKARSVAHKLPVDAHQTLILAGDTVAAKEGSVFGKPIDREDARRILLELAGTCHEVITGVTLLDITTGRRAIRSVQTKVRMRAMTAQQLDAYLDSGAWRGKAGAYGIQDHGDEFVTSIQGSYSNVVGFPMELVQSMLAAQGVRPINRGVAR